MNSSGAGKTRGRRSRNVAIYCDGACRKSLDSPFVAGWGFVVIEREDVFDHSKGTELARAFGGVETVPGGVRFHGATQQTNQTAELTSVLEGLLWVKRYRGRKNLGRVALFSDSKYAINMTLGTWKPDDDDEMENRDLVLACRAAQDAVDARLRWVPGHAGVRWNEAADGLAAKALEVLKPIPRTRTPGGA